MEKVIVFLPDLFMGAIASLAFIEGHVDNLLRRRGVNPHRLDIAAPTGFIYVVACISFQEYLNPWLLFLVAFVFRGSMFDLIYNSFAGQPLNHFSDKWYDRFKTRIPSWLLMAARIFGILTSYFIIQHYGRV